MRLRVLIYCDDPDSGGTAASTHQLALGLAGRGYRVTCSLTRNDPARIEERARAGIEHAFIPYDTIQHYYLATRDRAFPAAVFQAVEPDLVLFADSTPESTLIAKDVAAGLGIPFLTVKHMVLPDNPATASPGIRALIRRSCELARRVVTVSEATRTQLCREFDIAPAHTAIIPNSRPAVFFEPPSAENREALRREWSIPAEAFVVMTVGGVSRLKGVDIALNAVRRLVHEHGLTDLVFVWVGDGDPAVLAEQQATVTAAGIAPHVRFVGRRADVARCLDAADAFLSPSLCESFSLALLEAMAKSLPVVATAVGGVPETVENGGVLVADPMADRNAAVQGIAATLASWRHSPETARAVAERGARRAREAFDAERLLDRFCRLIDTAAFPESDYVSPGLTAIKPDRRFPTLLALDERVRTSGVRRGLRHTRYADGKDLHRIILSRDEAILVHNLALGFAGYAGLQIGADMGWAACHTAMAGVALDVLDPRLGDAALQAAVKTALHGFPGCGLWLGRGADAVRQIAAQTGRRWSFFLFNLPDPEPDLDAVVAACEEHAAPDAMLVFWNLLSSNAGPQLEPLRARGWRIVLYDTAQMIAVACRGTAVPVPHLPDPRSEWLRPHDLPEFRTAPRPAP